jgi:hypothetical protein
MEIVNANTLDAKDVLLEMILKTNPSPTREQIEEWLLLNLGTDLFGAWLTYDKNEVVGMLVAETVMGDSAYLGFEWMKAGVSKKELLDKAEQWAKDLGLVKMIRYTNKSPATYKKFGWSVFQTVLVKEL